MTAREVLRRVLLWGIVALFLATSIALAASGTWTGLLGFTGFPVVGAVILTSRPGNGVGRYLLTVGVLCIAMMWGLDVELARMASPWAEALTTAVAGFVWSGLVVIGAIYPTGRAETTLGRRAAWSVLAVALLSFATSLVTPTTLSGRPNPFRAPLPDEVVLATQWAITGGIVLAVAMIVVDLVRRWRVASDVGSLQYRWFVFGLASAIAAVAVAGLLYAIAPGSPQFEIVLVVATLAFNLVPVAIGIAITRHGLYEIGRVMSRTVTYGVVTVLVLAVYAVIVTSTARLLPELPSLGVALATLAAAALALPALRRVQRVVDRRFDRERYDAAQVVDAFGERLRTRADPSAARGELLTAVESALRPACVGLWTSEERS